MYPHRINLGGPWEVSTETKKTRLTIPCRLDQQPGWEQVAGPVVFRRTFRWPKKLMPFERLWLVMNAPDPYMKVRLNESLLHVADFQKPDLIEPTRRPQRAIDISYQIQEKNKLEVTFQNSPSTQGRLMRGFWGSVYLEVRRDIHLTGLVGTLVWEKHFPRLQLIANVAGHTDRKLSVVVRLDHHEVLYQELSCLGSSLEVTTPPLEIALWQPHQANVLHRLEVHLLDPACLLDQHTYAVGFSRVINQGAGQYLINNHLISNLQPIDLDEPLSESVTLDQADHLGKPIVLRLPAPDIECEPFLWYHPCVIGRVIPSPATPSLPSSPDCS